MNRRAELMDSESIGMHRSGSLYVSVSSREGGDGDASLQEKRNKEVMFSWRSFTS